MYSSYSSTFFLFFFFLHPSRRSCHARLPHHHRHTVTNPLTLSYTRRIRETISNGEIIFFHLPPHRSSTTILVPWHFGDGRVNRHHQGTDNHPKPHLLLTIECNHGGGVHILPRFWSILDERRNTMHQPTFHSPDYEEHHTVFSVNGVAHIASFSKAYSVEEHWKYDTRVSNDQIVRETFKSSLRDTCTIVAQKIPR